VLLPRLREWIRQTNFLNVKSKIADGVWPERLVIDDYNLECCAHAMEGHILINFKCNALEESYAVLEQCGLSPREIQVLSYLRLGHTNRLIAEAMNLSESMVKKHIGHIGHKLEAPGRTSILRRAEQLRRSLSK
jgi:DNA-binding CsgD family transcriptional regulator